MEFPLVGRTTLTEEDYVEAALDVGRRRGGQVRWLFALAALTLLMLLASRQDPAAFARFGWVALAALAAFAVGLWASEHRWVVTAKRRFAELPKTSAEAEYVLDVDGLTLRDASGWVRVPWSAVRQWRETPRAFLVFYTGEQYVLVPKRALPRETWQVRSWLRSRCVVPVSVLGPRSGKRRSRAGAAWGWRLLLGVGVTVTAAAAFAFAHVLAQLASVLGGPC